MPHSPEQPDPPYHLSAADAAYLLTLLEHGPADLVELSNEALVKLLDQTLRLAQSISENNRDWLASHGVVQAALGPDDRQHLNCCSLEGALLNALLTHRGDCTNTCPTCAFRPGSPASQAIGTVNDITSCLADGETFYCHHNLPGSGEPQSPCQGFRSLLKTQPSNDAPGD